MEHLQGSGLRGRITKNDVLQAAHENIQLPLEPTNEQKVEWLRQINLIRRFEEAAGAAYNRTKVGGFLHLGIGEEASIVGCCAALHPKDYLFCTYRSHGHAIARGTDPEAVMKELYGREGGTSGGRGGSMHVFDGERRFMGGYGIVAGNIPLAAGAALSIKRLGEDAAVLCSFGDGASNQGNTTETMNMASLWGLPMVFLISNNLYGMGTSIERHAADVHLSKRGEPYGIEGRTCDGMDVEATYQATLQAMNDAKRDQRPIVLEVMTYRFRGHSAADPQEYRTKEEVEEHKKQDPLHLWGEHLVSQGIIDQDGVEKIDQEATAQIQDVVAQAEAAPEPSIADLQKDVYVDSPSVPGSLETER
jgi:pyruvate dehydrogenase E1 component alpha subunit